jgi:hypothetical protein
LRRDAGRPRRCPSGYLGQRRLVSRTAREPLRVLNWHVHGSYLNYLTQVSVTWLVPVRPTAATGTAAAARFRWGDNVVKVEADEERELDADQVCARHRPDWEVDRRELSGDRVDDLPRIHIGNPYRQLVERHLWTAANGIQTTQDARAAIAAYFRSGRSGNCCCRRWISVSPACARRSAKTSTGQR